MMILSFELTCDECKLTVDAMKFHSICFNASKICDGISLLTGSEIKTGAGLGERENRKSYNLAVHEYLGKLYYSKMKLLT